MIGNALLKKFSVWDCVNCQIGVKHSAFDIAPYTETTNWQITQVCSPKNVAIVKNVISNTALQVLLDWWAVWAINPTCWKQGQYHSFLDRRAYLSYAHNSQTSQQPYSQLHPWKNKDWWHQILISLNKDRPTWCHSLYYFTISCSTCFEC